MSASPVPWNLSTPDDDSFNGGKGIHIVDANRRYVAKFDAVERGKYCEEKNKANTELMLRAVNSHEELVKALEAAKAHLEYCGYGDNWERECAYDSNLPEQIDAALAKAKEASK